VSMNSPTQHYLNWFRRLAVDQRTDVAALVGVNMPGSALSFELSCEQLVTDFVSWIESVVADTAFRNVGMTVSLIAVTEFWIIRRRDNLQGWLQVASELNHLSKKTGKDVFAQQAARKDFEGRQWVAACEKWKALRSTNLSDLAIEAWLEQSSRPQ